MDSLSGINLDKVNFDINSILTDIKSVIGNDETTGIKLDEVKINPVDMHEIYKAMQKAV